MSLSKPTARNELIHAQVFGQAVHVCRDLHHVLMNARKLPAHISHGAAFSAYVVGEIQYTAPLASAALFSCAWESIISDFVEAGRLKLASWLHECLLSWNERTKLYRAAWKGGISVPFLPPGYGPMTCQQSLERLNGILKGALPVNFHKQCLSAISPLLEASLRAHMCAVLSCDEWQQDANGTNLSV